MRLAPRKLAALFAVGAVGGLIGDQAHVASHATRYLDDSLPFVWKSELWFPVAVGLGTASLAEIRLRLAPAASGGFDLREALAGIASVLAVYATTAVVTDEATGTSVALTTALAALVACRFASGWPALVCGVIAAVVGPALEIVVVHADLSAYGHNVDGLFGVAPWLPALYFAFGVVVSRLAELASDPPVAQDVHG